MPDPTPPGPPRERELPYGPSGPMPLEPGTLEGMNMHLAVLGLPPLKEAWDNPPLAREVHNILTAAKPVLLARLAATTGAEIEGLVNAYAGHCRAHQRSNDQETWPQEDDWGTRRKLTIERMEAARTAILAAFAALQQRVEEAERDDKEWAEDYRASIRQAEAEIVRLTAALTEAEASAKKWEPPETCYNVVCSVELAEQMGQGWSEPLELRITYRDDGKLQFMARKFDRTEARRAAREELLTAEPTGPWKIGRHAEPKEWGGEITWSVGYQNWTYGPFLMEREARAVANALNDIRALPDAGGGSA